MTTQWNKLTKRNKKEKKRKQSSRKRRQKWRQKGNNFFFKEAHFLRSLVLQSWQWTYFDSFLWKNMHHWIYPTQLKLHTGKNTADLVRKGEGVRVERYNESISPKTSHYYHNKVVTSMKCITFYRQFLLSGRRHFLCPCDETGLRVRR